MGRIAEGMVSYLNNNFIRDELALAKCTLGEDDGVLEIWFKKDLCPDTHKFMDVTVAPGDRCGIGLGPKTRATVRLLRERMEFTVDDVTSEIPYGAIYALVVPPEYGEQLGWAVAPDENNRELAFLDLEKLFASTPKDNV